MYDWTVQLIVLICTIVRRTLAINIGQKCQHASLVTQIIFIELLPFALFYPKVAK